MDRIRLLGEVAVGRGATKFLLTGLIVGLSTILSEMFMLLVSGSHYLWFLLKDILEACLRSL